MSGSSRRRRIAARRPSSVPSGGICTSTMATSGRCAEALRISVVGVARLGHDVEPLLLEQAGEALAQEDLVLRDQDARRRHRPGW